MDKQEGSQGKKESAQKADSFFIDVFSQAGRLHVRSRILFGEPPRLQHASIGLAVTQPA